MENKNRPDKKIVCIINPAAANRRWTRRRSLRTKLIESLPGKCLDAPRSKEETVAMSKAACQEADLIVAVGGDGTIADVLQGIFQSPRRSEITFGVIPFGSGNAFRKSLGIPRQPFKAVKYLLEGDLLTVDLIQIEDRVAGFASVGSTAAVTGEKIKHSIPGLIGHLLAARRLLLYKREEKIIELREGLDQQGNKFNYLELPSHFLDSVIGKFNYFGYSWLVAPAARLNDGYLDLVLFEMAPLLYILSFPLIYFGFLQKKLRHFKAKEITIKGRNLDVQYNGEYLTALDTVRARVLPASLKVMANKEKARRFLIERNDAN
ncbi:MAG TPA: diacylglycerol kinase family protein [Candidatus Saccharicenans sp.]|nr:diacylglycerol kinase family protein [Candidatus Saccharicenans sp.]